MKLTGLGTIVCAAMLTMACAGDGREGYENESDRTATTGAAGENDELFGGGTGEQARLEPGDDPLGTGMARSDGSMGGVGTSGQSHGPDTAHDFMTKAAMTGHAEVQLGQLAVERAQSPDVKEFAQMMVRDHTKSNKELSAAVTTQDVKIAPVMDQKHQQLIERLRTLRGAEFDREYMKAMVEGHTEAKNMLETRANQGQTARTGQPNQGQAARNEAGAQGQARRDDRGATGTSGVATGGSQLENAINQWATKTLPTIEQHLQRAQQINSKLGNSNPSGANTNRR